MAGHMHDYDTIVIGGGFAGVTACRDLAEQGYSVLLLEARDRLGGRTWSTQRKIGDYEGIVELGGQWVWPDRNLFMGGEIERYGLTLRHSPAAKSYPTLIGGKHNPGPLPVPAEDIIDFERAAFQILTDAHRITPGLPLDRQNVGDLDIPFSEYLDRLDVCDSVKGFFTFLPSFFTGRYPDEVSALPVLQYVAHCDHSLIQTWGILDEYIVEGTSALINAMAEDSGADIRLETPVARIAQDDDMVTVTTQAGQSYTAQSAIVATPVAMWKHLEFDPPIDEHKRGASEEQGVAYAIKVWAQVKNAPKFPFALADPVTSDGAYTLFTEHDLGEDGQIMCGFCMSRPEDDRPHFKPDFAGVEGFVKTMFPEAELLAFDCHPWVEDEWAGYGDWAAWKPGRMSKSHSQLSRPEGRLYFATSDIALTFINWMDGAMEMGKKAATDAQRQMLREAVGLEVRARGTA